MDSSASGHASPPLIEIEKHFVFSCSLLQLQLEGPLIPGSDPPCSHCKSKRVKCICEAVKQVGRAAAYDAPELLPVKERLERSRERLSAIPIQDWKRHTSKTDVLKQVIPTIKQKVHDSQGHFPELLINSWTKLFEILTKTPVLRLKLQQQQQQQQQPRVVKSVHLCECPGGFVAATNHFLKTQAKGLLHSWRATSLNPYYEGCSPLEALDDDGVYRHTERRWILSPDGSGDLRSKAAIEYLWKHLTRPPHHSVPPFGLADFVTADGSFDVQFDPARQEELVAPLVYAEVVAILGLLQIHGSAVIKAYALHTHHSFSVLALLSMCFKTVAVVKPLMSRGGNSEVYLLGIDFRGIRSPLLRALSFAVDSFSPASAIIPREWLPDDFVAECAECARFFTELQAEHLEISLERFKNLSSQDMWQLSLEKERIASAFIESTNLLPIRFEDRIVPDKDFVNDLEAHGFTNSTRRGSRERVQGVLAERASFREVYRQLHQQRQQQWQQNGGSSRALCLLTPQAAAKALLQCTYPPFERAKAAINDKKRKRGCSNNGKESSGGDMLRDFFVFDDEGDSKELPVKEGEPLWLCLYAQETPSQQQQQQQQQPLEASDVASFFSTFASRARQGWNEHQQQLEPQQQQHEQQQRQQQRRLICVPSAAAVAWRDEMLQGLKKNEFHAGPSVWLTLFKAMGKAAAGAAAAAGPAAGAGAAVAAAKLKGAWQTSALMSRGLDTSMGLHACAFQVFAPVALGFMRPLNCSEPYRIQTSRFADDRLMTIVTELRHQLPFFFPLTTSDLLLLEAPALSPPPVRLRPEELPPRCCVDLLLAMKALGSQASTGALREAELPALWRKQYAVCVELSTWTTPLALPLQLVLRRYGCGCFVVVNPPRHQQHHQQQHHQQQHDQQQQQQQQQQRGLTAEDLETASARSGPILGVKEVDVLEAFASAQPADILKRHLQEWVLPKLPGGGASLVSIDVTGVQHWRLHASREKEMRARRREREGDGQIYADKEQPGRPGVVLETHEEIAQDEMEAGLFLLAQLIQGLTLLSAGGDLVIRFHSSYTRFTATLLMVCSLCFCSSGLFKPPSVPSWCTDTFFLGRDRRHMETGLVLQLLYAAWNVMVAANRRDKDREAASARSGRSNKREGEAAAAGNASSKETYINFGGLTVEWALQQCIKAKLFTELVANRWLLSFNNHLLRHQVKDLKERLELLCAASRAAGPLEGSPNPKAQAAAAIAFRFPTPQERRKRVAFFLREHGILDLMLRADSPYHLALGNEEGLSNEGDDSGHEWGGVSFENLETLSLLAGARLSLAPPAGDELWTEA